MQVLKKTRLDKTYLLEPHVWPEHWYDDRKMIVQVVVVVGVLVALAMVVALDMPGGNLVCIAWIPWCNFLRATTRELKRVSQAPSQLVEICRWWRRRLLSIGEILDFNVSSMVCRMEAISTPAHHNFRSRKSTIPHVRLARELTLMYFYRRAGARAKHAISSATAALPESCVSQT